MAEIVTILPQCVQSVAVQGITAVGCDRSLDCACHSLKFLNHLQLSIVTSSCSPEDMQSALGSARHYCSAVNPSLRDTRITLLYSTVLSFTVLALLAVILRFWSRRVAKIHLGWDDWFIIPALFSAVAVDTQLLLGTRYGGARHSFMVIPTSVTLKTQLATAWAIVTCGMFVRLSILALYIRIFSTLKILRRVLFATAWIEVIILLAGAMLYTFSCRPVSYFWNKDIPGGHCLDGPKILAAVCAVDSATGFWVLVLPVQVIRDLQYVLSAPFFLVSPTLKFSRGGAQHVSQGLFACEAYLLVQPSPLDGNADIGTINRTGFRRKVALIVLFSVGTFVCVTALIRIPFILEIKADDVNWTIVPVSVWTGIEVNLGGYFLAILYGYIEHQSHTSTK